MAISGWPETSAQQKVLMDEMRKMSIQAGVGGSVGLGGLGTQTSNAKSVGVASHRTDMIAMRLRCTADTMPFKNFATFLEGDTVYVVVILPAGPSILEDNPDMFPSDTLISQLRLLLP